MERAKTLETPATGRLQRNIVADYLSDVDPSLELFLVAVLDSACHTLILG